MYGIIVRVFLIAFFLFLGLFIVVSIIIQAWLKHRENWKNAITFSMFYYLVYAISPTLPSIKSL
ncbi:hypothetical protein CW732_15960 [Olleya sp. Bg11-27]|nr:hypothetical protein CW732_15960 [Olleya sp. Bg11-27]